MSGPDTNNVSRREFLLSALGIIPLAGMLAPGCTTNKYSHIKGSIVGGASGRGHLLRDNHFTTPEVTLKKDVVIVGGGVAGLSVARKLREIGSECTVFELDQRVGGNAVSDSNHISAYPWGAHYLPVPDHRDRELLRFLEQCGTIESYAPTGLPVYNELHLCFDPEERLFINGFWQEGLVPHFGVPESEQQQTARFFEMIAAFRTAKGNDGKDAFCIPLKNASADPQYTKLDTIPFARYLSEQGFTSRYLLWYLDYCCRDDYGTSITDTSAWAGIHYFASRKGEAANASSSTVLTWPEGNAWLVQQLKQQAAQTIQTDMLVYRVDLDKQNHVVLDGFNFTTNRTERILCNQVIMATPQFVSNRLLSPGLVNTERTSGFTYAPWMVANITTQAISGEKGHSICWDNVFYGSKSLGYVDATHQHMKLYARQKVLTYYLPLADGSPSDERKQAYERTHEDWVKIICADIEKVNPDSIAAIEQMDIWLWGHGMIRPTPGFITGETRMAASASVHDKIFFAHSDLSGISIFEEAFHQGIDAAVSIGEQRKLRI